MTDEDEFIMTPEMSIEEQIEGQLRLHERVAKIRKDKEKNI